MKKAFTLVELLIVIIIIGILVAIAVPQYQKMVEKGYYPQAVTKLRAFVDAERMYYLEHGIYVGVATYWDGDDVKSRFETPGGGGGDLLIGVPYDENWAYGCHGVPDPEKGYFCDAWRRKGPYKATPSKPATIMMYIDSYETKAQNLPYDK